MGRIAEMNVLKKNFQRYDIDDLACIAHEAFYSFYQLYKF